jgi:metal-responsive CopG/Arc/MetJ family transcriptional regulator
MKTAISIPDEIFKEVEKFAKEHKYSKSKVVVVAIEEFLERIKLKQLLDTLNEVYSDIESTEDTMLREKAKRHYARRVLKEPY